MLTVRFAVEMRVHFVFRKLNSISIFATTINQQIVMWIKHSMIVFTTAMSNLQATLRTAKLNFEKVLDRMSM